MSIQQILYTVTSVSFVGLALLVLSTRLNRYIRYSAFTYMMGVVGWLIGIFMLSAATSQLDLLIWSRLIFLGPLGIAAGFFILVLSFPTFSIPEARLKKIIFFVFLFVIPVIFLLFWEIATRLPHVETLGLSMQNLKHGPSHPLFALYFVTVFFSAFFILYRKLKTSMGIQKEQLRYLFWGMTISFAIGATLNLFLPLTGNFAFIEYGPFCTILLLGFTTYAIVQHQLLDIKFVFSRGLGYTLLTTVVLLIYGVAIFFSEQLFKNISGYHSDITTGLITIGLVIVLQPLYHGIQEMVDRLFFKAKYDYKKTIHKLSEGIQSISELGEAQTLLLSTVVDAMKVSQGSIYLMDPKKQTFVKTTEKSFRTENRWKA